MIKPGDPPLTASQIIQLWLRNGDFGSEFRDHFNEWPAGMGSSNPNWISTANTVFDTLTQDGQMGVDSVIFDPIDSAGLKNSANSGGLVISSSTLGGSGSIRNESVHNYGYENAFIEGGSYVENAKVIDMTQISPSDISNGTIFSEEPLIIEKAFLLPKHLNIVSNRDIYLRGQFNNGSNSRGQIDKTKIKDVGLTSLHGRVWFLGHNWPNTPVFEQYDADGNVINGFKISDYGDQVPYFANVVERVPDTSGISASSGNFRQDYYHIMEAWGHDVVFARYGSIYNLRQGEKEMANIMYDSYGVPTYKKPKTNQFAWSLNASYGWPFRYYEYFEMDSIPNFNLNLKIKQGQNSVLQGSASFQILSAKYGD